MVYVVIGIVLVIILWIAVSGASRKRHGASLPSIKEGHAGQRTGTDTRSEIAKEVQDNPAKAAGSLRAMMDTLNKEKKKR